MNRVPGVDHLDDADFAMGAATNVWKPKTAVAGLASRDVDRRQGPGL